jgi:hypothetical protein
MANNPKDLYLPPNIVKTKKGNVTAVTGSTTPSFSLKSWLGENNFQPSPRNTAGEAMFYTDEPILLSETEQVLQSFRINANTYKQGDSFTFGPAIYLSGNTKDDLSGWSNLSNVLTRNYSNFYSANAGSIGNNVVGTEFVMSETTSGRYWRIKFSSWTQGGNGGGFSYQRTEIDPNTGEDLEATVTFTKEDNVPNTDVIIPQVLEITRGDQQGIYNAALEQSYDNMSYVSPANTLWNSVYNLSKGEPIVVKCYWSYNKNGKDNLVQETIVGGPSFASIFSPSIGPDFFGMNQPSLELFTKIETPTILRSLTSEGFSDVSIPNVERDIYFTITCNKSSELISSRDGEEPFSEEREQVAVETFININFISLIKKTSDIFFFAESGQVFGRRESAIAYPGGIQVVLPDAEAPLP